MPTTSTAALVHQQAERAQQLFEDLVHLHTKITNSDHFQPLRDLDPLIAHARLIHTSLALLRGTFCHPPTKPHTHRQDCPDQLPLWHDATANLEE